MSKKNNLYNEHSIISETPLQFVRRTPATYLGSQRMNTALVLELYANCIDEHVIGHGERINISIDTESNEYSISDNGQGFLVNVVTDDSRKTILQRSFDTINTSGKTTEDGVYMGTSLGLNGIGAKLVCFLSYSLHVKTYRDNKFEEIWFKDGVFQKRNVGEEEHPSGTEINWSPDPQFFKENKPDIKYLKEFLSEIAALCPNLTTTLLYNGKETVFHEPGGLNSLMDKRVAGKELFTNRFNIERELGKDKINICLTYTTNYSDDVSAYVNLGHTDSGAHISAMKSSFVRAINKYATENNLIKKNEKNLDSNEVKEGLTIIFNVTTTSAKYDAQNKSRIDDIDASIINATMSGDFGTWLNQNPSEASIIIERALNARRAREAAKKAKEKIRKVSKKEKSLFADLPSKLSDAYPHNKNDRSHCELFLAEGDSAASSINSTKDSSFQATFPLRGKVLCCQTAPLEKIYANAEIGNIVKALGLDIEKDTGKLKYDKKKLRYDKIILACFTGDTKIKSLDGKSYSFKELVDAGIEELWVYSMNSDGEVVPALAKNIKETRKTNKLIKLTLDNGEEIKSTEDHLYLLPDLSYKRADKLKIGDSLMPLYTKINEGKKEEYYDRNTNSYKLTHRMVAENILKEEMEEALKRLEKEDHKPPQNSIQVHHKNVFEENNSLNNIPENLEWLTAKEHFTAHSKLNSSKKGKEHFKELHKQGRLKNFATNGYNGSEEHLNAIQKAKEAGKYKESTYFNTYNKTQANKDSCKKSNSNPEHILHVNQTKFRRTLKYLIDNDLEINKENFNKYKYAGSPKFENLTKYFKDLDHALENIDKYHVDDYIMQIDYITEESKRNQKRSRILKVIKRLHDKNLELNKDNYNLVRIPSDKDPRFESILKHFSSLEEAYDAAKYYNHKITAIDYIEVDNESVYDVTVDEYHNFALDSGVFVHNCDNDTDGYSIQTLLITALNWLCQDLILNGHVYTAESALFKAIFKDGTYKLFADDAEFDNWKAKNPDAKYKLERNKGLGSLTTEDTYEQLVNPKTRNIRQVIFKDVEELEHYLELFEGNEVEPRRQFLAEHFNDYREV